MSDGLHLFDDEEPAKVEPKESVKNEKKPEVVASEDEDLGSEFENRYLVFVLNDEKFAVALASIGEVIEAPEYRQVPNTVPYFLGFFNLRGQVIGLIDLRKKFGYGDAEEGSTAMVFECPGGMLAALVDRIDKIEIVMDEDIEKEPRIKSKLPMEYVMGVSRKECFSGVFLDLKKVLTDDDWVKVKAMGAS